MEVITNFDIHCGEDIHAAILRVDHDFYVPVKRYRDDHVFDEDKSVKWNREEVARQNEKQIELQRQARDMCAQSHENLNEAIYKYIMNEAVYGHYFSRAEAAFIWSHCCRHHVSNPWDWIDEMADTIHEYELIMENEK